MSGATTSDLLDERCNHVRSIPPPPPCPPLTVSIHLPALCLPCCSWSVGLAAFPHPSVKSPSLIGQFAPTFLFASIMFQVGVRAGGWV